MPSRRLLCALGDSRTFSRSVSLLHSRKVNTSAIDSLVLRSGVNVLLLPDFLSFLCINLFSRLSPLILQKKKTTTTTLFTSFPSPALGISQSEQRFYRDTVRPKQQNFAQFISTLYLQMPPNIQLSWIKKIL